MENKKDFKLAVNVRDGSTSVAIFHRQFLGDDGRMHNSYGACLQRSYKPKDAKSDDDYKRETINFFPDEMLKVSLLLQDAYKEMVKYSQEERAKAKAGQSMNRPTQTIDDNEPPAWVSEEVPF